MEFKYRLLTPGPTMIPEEVKSELSKDIIHHRKDKFRSIMLLLQDKLKILFGTKEDVLILSSSGTGAMQAALFNLFNPNDKVIVVEGGKFGKRWTEIAKKRELQPIVIEVEWGKAVDPEIIEQTIKKEKDIKGVLIQASETSTGVLHPIKEIGERLKKYNILLVVDGISAVGISPLPMDKWNIDCLITGSQKGLMLPPGLSLISLSEKAYKMALEVNSKDFYFDLKKEKKKIKNGETAYTSPVGLIIGLNATMDLFLNFGLENLYKKYWAITQMTRYGVEAIGLNCFAKKNYTWGLTSVELPQDIDGNRLLNKIASTFNLYLAGGQDHLKGRIIRIGHMGYVDMSDVLLALNAIAWTIKKEYNVSVKEKDFLEQATEVYFNALKEGYEKYFSV